MKALRLLLAVAAVCGAVFLTACAGGSGAGRDALGHRPGPKGFRTVVIDAGHGGHDSGAVSPVTRQREKDLALDVAQRVRTHLGGSFRVHLLRGSDEFVDLDRRVHLASQSGAGALVSIHFNAGPSRIRGPETFYWRVDSHSLAKRLQRHLAAVSPVESGNRGLVRRRIRLTRNPQIPCVLVECGYLTNPVEARLCADARYRDRLARAIADGIREQAAHGDAGMGPLPRPLNAPLSRATDPPE